MGSSLEKLESIYHLQNFAQTLWKSQEHFDFTVSHWRNIWTLS